MYLKSLLGEKEFNNFLICYKENRPFFLERINFSGLGSEIKELAFLRSLDDLITFWKKEVDVHLPEVADEADSITVEASQAKSFLKKGMGLLFNDIDRDSPVLTKWANEIRSEIGLSQMTYSRSLAYVTAAGKGTATHFDQNINFVLQMTGQKRWWLAENDSVDNPLTRHTLGQSLDPELGSYMKNMLPESIPENAEVYDLKAGSFLFVPRGVWHKTLAEKEALSLNFTYSAPSWLDLFSAALRGRLAMSKKWRETAIFGDSGQGTAIFNELLNELGDDVKNWKAEDIISVTEG